MARVAIVARIMIALFVIACGVGGAYRLGASVDDPFGTPAAANAPVVVAVEGTIRNAGAGWYVVSDSHHHPVNLTVDPDGNVVTIRYPRGTSVLSMTASVNSQLAHYGISVRITAAADHATLRLSRTVHHRVHQLNAGAVHHPFGEIRILGFVEPAPLGANS
jgi:hypothetical protein